MKQLFQNIFVIIFLFFLTTEVTAEEQIKIRSSFWQFKANIGYNIGGSSPLPLPQEVREIKSYSPAAFAPHLAFEATYWFNPKWGITTQASFDLKGFKVTDEVQYLKTKMKIGEGSQTGVFEGVFSGQNTTEVSNSYFTVPILVSFHPSDKWTIQGGLFVSYLYSASFKGSASNGYLRQGDPTGEKIEVTSANFDFSDNLRKFDWGVEGAAEWQFSKSFALRGQIAWSLVPLFPSDFTGMPFKMYNIYGTVGVSYNFKSL